MAWTAPKTFSDGVALTANELNTYLRDNLMETMTAKATTNGGLFFSTDVNEWTERYPNYARTNGTITTSSATYQDLGGPRVTCTTGTDVLLFFAAHVGNTNASAATYMSYNVSGATVIASAASQGLRIDGVAANTGDNYIGAGMFDMRSDLTPGENTFKLTYRVDAGTGSWTYSMLAVIPLS